MNELSPCPFCGGEAELYRRGNDYTKSQSAIVKCKTWGCCVQKEVRVIRQSYEWAVEKVTEKWNTRTADPVADKLAKQLSLMKTAYENHFNRFHGGLSLSLRVREADNALTEYEAFK